MGWPIDRSSSVILKKSVLKLMDGIVYVPALLRADRQIETRGRKMCVHTCSTSENTLSNNLKMAVLVCLLFEGNNFRLKARNITFERRTFGVFSCSGKFISGEKFTLVGRTNGHKYC